MSLGKNLGKIGGYLLGEGIAGLQGAVDTKMDEIKQKVEIAIQHAAKKLTIIILLLLGAIFVLVGLGQYLNETVSGLEHGLGYLLIGAIILVIGIIGRAFSGK